MAIEFKCPHCQTILKAGENMAGSTGNCPKCGKSVTVPQPQEEGKKT